MHLSKLEMQGFKSFMHKTSLDFESGITAILGPNGCGKSNVVDALRWVLGEQSAKLLRGDKMENVIFDGTKKRPPMGVAEVALTFTGASETLAVDWDELTLKRRVTRAGGSEYFLNNQPYRLHEIRDLLAGTGLGNHAYAIIERNIVEEVVSESGDKRRILFEEASGIMRYKMRRKESLSKLKSTEGDLTRLDDILEELGKNVRSLKYQVGRARSYQRLQEEIKEGESHGAAVKLHAAWQQSRDLNKRLEGLGDESRSDETQMALIDEESARLQAEMLERESDYQNERGRLDERTAGYRKLEESLAVLDEKCRAEERRAEDLTREARMAAAALDRLAKERADLETERLELDSRGEQIAVALAESEKESGQAKGVYFEQREKLQHEKQLRLNFAQNRAETGGELERLRERFAQSRSRGDELIAEQARVRGQAETLRREFDESTSEEKRAEAFLAECVSAIAELEIQLVGYEAELAATIEEIRTLELRREKTGTRLELLEHLQLTGAGQAPGTQWLLEAKTESANLRGILADRLRVSAEHRPAVEAALESVLTAAIVADGGSALSWLREAEAADAGRALLLALDLGTRPSESSVSPAEGMRPLAELVECDSELSDLVAGLLAGHWLAPDNETALSVLGGGAAGNVTLVTPEGTILRHDGMISGAEQGIAAGGSLGRAQEIETLQGEMVEIAARAESLAEARANTTEILRDARAELDSSRQKRDRARAAFATQSLDRTRLETRLTALDEEETGLEADRLYHERQTDSLSEALEASESEWTKLADAGPEEAIDLADLEVQVSRLERVREEQDARLAEHRLEATTARGRRENLKLREENLEQAVVGEWSRRKESEEGEAKSREEVAELKERSVDLRETLANMQTELEQEQQGSERIATEIGTLREKLQEQQSTGRSLREMQREKEQTLHNLDIERNTLLVRMQGIQDAVKHSHGIDLDPAQDPEAGEGYRPPEGVEIEEHLESLQVKIQRIGTVNLLALEEFEEQNERYEFLQAQREDLVKARDGLLETIQRINREARQRFTETFKVIRTNFIEIFKTLFEGGEADLAYVIDDDPLQADIVITAKPKEKNISSVKLLSSGEKTLTALSLLFAIYLTKPSPFCVFDEVDAPLDDANIARFLRLVREFSSRTQFLLITHNKKTMEVARHLYGVTMEESGVSKVVSVAFDEVPDDMLADAAGAGKK